ncbi:MAG: type VI secretion system-associated protein TagO [Dokdonella sp.]
MTKCKECQADISTKADACQKCGAKAPKKTSGCTWIVAIFLALPFLILWLKSVERESTVHPPSPSVAEKAAGTSNNSSAGKEKVNAPLVSADAMRDFHESGGAWEIAESTDSMTGKKAITLQTPAQRFEQDKYGRRVVGRLYVRCANSKTEVAVMTDTFISTNPTAVMYRIDEGTPKTREWLVSTDYQAVFAPQAVSLVKAMQGASDFRVRFTPHGESPMEFYFTIAGLEVYVPKLRKACGW